MGSEALVQAIIVGARVFIVAGLGAIGSDAVNLVQIGTAGNEIAAGLALAIVPAVISALLKIVGGPTVPAPVTGGVRGAPGDGRVASAERPNVFAV